MIPWLEDDMPFPPVQQALSAADGASGLLAASGHLSPQRLLDAYRHGIFPWYSDGQPVLWWSPDPRMVLYTDRLICSTSLKKSAGKISRSMRDGGPWQIRFDSEFEAVMRACARPRALQDGTWITEPIIAAYTALHRRGYAHSSELWRGDELMAGAYGVAIGRMFYGESMFTRVSDGSKIALVYLTRFLQRHGVALIDCQQETAHLASLGAVPISRADFIAHLTQATAQPPIAEWQIGACEQA